VSETPSDVIAQRIRQLREARGWTVAELAARCKDAGLPRLTATVLYKMESQRQNRAPRPVTVDELLILAFVLDIAPVHLIAGLDEDARLPVSPDWSVWASSARQWIRGFAPMAGGDKRRYEANVPPSEADAQWFMIQDATSYEQVVQALEGLKLFANFKQQQRPAIVAAIVTSPLGVLVGRRNDGTPPWTFIAGEQDAVKDENPADTAVREVKEETGLRIQAGELIGERIHPKTGRTMIYIAATPTHGTEIFVNDERELAEVRWVGLAEADELLPGMFGPVREHLARELSGEG
jgi:8-oxo-dGTP diphosphatase